MVRSRARRERTPDGGAFSAAVRALQLLASLDRLFDVLQPLQTSVEVHLGAPQDAVLVRPGVFDAVLVGKERAREIAHRGRRHAASVHRGVDVREQPGRPVALRGGAEGAHARRLERPLSGRREPVGRGAGGIHRARVTGRRGERTAFTPRVLDARPRVARSRVLFHRVRHSRVSFRGHERRRNPRRGGLAHLAVADGQISFLDSCELLSSNIVHPEGQGLGIEVIQRVEARARRAPRRTRSARAHAFAPRGRFPGRLRSAAVDPWSTFVRPVEGTARSAARNPPFADCRAHAIMPRGARDPASLLPPRTRDPPAGITRD